MATTYSLESKLHFKTLPKETNVAFLKCSRMPFFAKGGWYLAGGTALALQIGHRQSVDLDFFTTKKKFDELMAERIFFNAGNWQMTMRDEGTIYGVFHGAKISLIAYPFFIPSTSRVKFGTINILKSADIAVMKIMAVSQRGRKRDFYDLYWYCKNFENLKEIVLRAVHQFPGQEKNIHHIIKSFIYFTDAESDPEPKINFKTNWLVVKKFFVQEAKILSKEFGFIE